MLQTITHIYADTQIIIMLNPVCLALILFYSLPVNGMGAEVVLALRAAAVITVLLFIFMLFGVGLLQQFAISLQVFTLFGSIYLILSCLKVLLFPNGLGGASFDLVSPFAFPIAAGPLILSKMMQLDHSVHDSMQHVVSSVLNCMFIMGVIVLVFIAVALILRLPKMGHVMPVIIKLSYVFYACLGLQSAITICLNLAINK